MQDIYADLDQIKSIANETKQYIDDMGNSMIKAKEIKDQLLETSWGGPDSIEFNKRFEAWWTNIYQYIYALDEINSFVHTFVKDSEEFENGALETANNKLELK